MTEAEKRAHRCCFLGTIPGPRPVDDVKVALENRILEAIKEGYTTLKMLNPISDDRRHEFKVNLDFRYGNGSKYNGPTITRRFGQGILLSDCGRRIKRSD